MKQACSRNLEIPILNSFYYEEKFSSMEKKAPNEMEMAAQENEEREKAEKAAQGWVRALNLKNIFLLLF